MPLRWHSQHVRSAAVNPRALSLELPIHGASDSSQPIGHCRVSFRCSASLQPAARAYLAGAARAPHRTSPAPHGARQPHSPREWSECSMTDLDRSAEAHGVAQRASDDTTTWPADRTLNAIVCVHSLELLGPWASAPARTWESFVVFWSLLDSLVAAQLESTAERPCRGAHLALGDTTVYDLGGGSAEHQRARVRGHRRLDGICTIRPMSCGSSQAQLLVSAAWSVV